MSPPTKIRGPGKNAPPSTAATATAKAPPTGTPSAALAGTIILQLAEELRLSFPVDRIVRTEIPRCPRLCHRRRGIAKRFIKVAAKIGKRGGSRTQPATLLEHDRSLNDLFAIAALERSDRNCR